MQERYLVIDTRRAIVCMLAITLLLLPVVAFTEGVARVVLGLPFVLLFPGYSLLSTLLPRRSDMDSFRRVVFSVLLSVIILALVGLVLNYTPWGIRPLPVLVTTFLLITLSSVVAYYRQQRLPEDEIPRFTLPLRLTGWSRTTRPGRIAAITLGLAALTAAGSLGYALISPTPGEKYTEFYILDSRDGAAAYPLQTSAGEPVQLDIVVANHEHEPLRYRVKITSDGAVLGELSTGLINHGDDWRGTADFVLATPGNKQKVELYLYRGESSQPCFDAPLQVFVDVR